MNNPLRAAGVLLSLLSLCASIQARTLLVPQQYELIQSAVDASRDGDSILIAPGEYPQYFSLSGHNIRIIGDPTDPSRVVLSGQDERRVISMTRGETDVVLSGLTFSGGRADLGGGLYLSNGAYPRIEYCCFQANFAAVSGGAIFCSAETGVGVVLINCTFFRNDAPRGDAVVAGVDFRMINCIVWDNQDNNQEVRLEQNDASILYSLILGGQRSIAGIPQELIVFDFDPLFVNHDGFNLSLRRDSRCIDAGDPDQPGDSDGTVSDLGAFTHLIEGPPTPRYYPAQLDFGTVPIGSAVELPVEVFNVGSETLRLDEVFVEAEGFSYQGENNFDIEPRRRIFLPVTFAPEDEGEWEGHLELAYGNYGEGWDRVSLAGRGEYPPEVHVEPVDYFFEADSAEYSEYVLNIANDGGGILEFRLQKEYGDLPAEGNNDFNNPPDGSGPQRVSAGDVLRRYELSLGRTVGMAWDGERMWGASDERQVLFSVDPETGLLEDSVRIEQRPRGLAYYEGRLYSSFPSTGSIIYVYDLEGNLVEQLECPARDICGLAFDDRNHLYLATYQFQQLYVLSRDNLEMLARISILEAIRHPGFSITRLDYQPTHENGPLWMLLGNFDLRMSLAVQCNLDEQWRLTEVQSIRLRDFGNTGIAGDGQNLWHGGEQNGHTWVVYDNGIPEQTWLALEEDRGILASQGDVDIIFSVQTDLMRRGDYQCVIHVLSNDPRHPDVPVTVQLHVYENGVSEESTPVTAAAFRLEEAYPNPFNGSTTIGYTLTVAGHVSLGIYDLSGRLIADLVEGWNPAGRQEVVWEADNLPAGLYIVRLAGDDFYTAKKLSLVK